MINKTIPSVSVIIPVYNGINYLREAIDSVLNQTYNNYEIIVVDDGSTDDTWAVIQSYGSKIMGIRQNNHGVGGALNTGIKASTNDYIAWLSHDDMFLPTKLQCQIDFLLHNNQFDACYTDFYQINTSGSILRTFESPWYPREQAMWMMFRQMYIHGSTMLINRKCFNKVGLFSEELRYTQDAEMWLRIIRHFSIGRVPETLGKQRIHPAQDSNNVEKTQPEIKIMYKKIFSTFLADGLFPKNAITSNPTKKMALAYEWLGDNMLPYYRFYDFADELYSRSITIWPSWKNTARRKKLIIQMRFIVLPFYRYIKRILNSAYSYFFNTIKNEPKH